MNGFIDYSLWCFSDARNIMLLFLKGAVRLHILPLRPKKAVDDVQHRQSILRQYRCPVYMCQANSSAWTARGQPMVFVPLDDFVGPIVKTAN